jgi:hypothetical protein
MVSLLWKQWSMVMVGVVVITTTDDMLDFNHIFTTDCYVADRLQWMHVDATLMRSLLDMVQVFVLSVFPFPWTSYLSIWCTKAVQHFILLRPCYNSSDGNVYYWYATLFILGTSFAQLLLSIKFKCCFNDNRGVRVDETADKRSIIKLLIVGVKLPLHHVERTLNSFHLENRQIFEERQKLVKNIEDEMIRFDEYLLVAKIEEGRFTFHTKDDVNIRDTLYELLGIVFEKSTLVLRYLVLSVSYVELVRTKRALFSVLLRHLLMYVRECLADPDVIIGK